MDPRDIALSEEIITEFDASQAFYIGFLAGLKINIFIDTINSNHSKIKKPTLYLVK